MARMNATRLGVAVCAAGVVSLAGCDLSVTNPGPVQDGFLNDEGAHSAVVSGVALNLANGLNWVNFFGGEAAKDFTQGGRIHPVKLPADPGQLTVDGIPDTPFDEPNQARWIAEDAVRRLREHRPSFDSDALAARALLYAGYANRILGENMCEAVIDGGAPQSHTVFFERAESHFTEAAQVAAAAGESEVETAAYAGRASVRLLLGDDAGAVADAGMVPEDFVFQAEYSAGAESQYNFIYWVSANNPYRAHTVWNTYYEDYYLNTGDPRVSWGQDPDVPTAEFTYAPWYFQTKYTTRGANVNLSSGPEMELIEAEVLLRQGDWEGAMGLINGLREGLVSDHDGTPIPLWTASSAEEAWSHLKRERGIELWLEARRLGDLRRWIENGVPGETDDVSDRIRLCIPITNGERRTNPNVTLDHQDPVNPAYSGG